MRNPAYEYPAGQHRRFVERFFMWYTHCSRRFNQKFCFLQASKVEHIFCDDESALLKNENRNRANILYRTPAKILTLHQYNFTAQKTKSSPTKTFSFERTLK